MKYQEDKWVVKVYQNGDYAYARPFRTKKLADAFCNEIGSYSDEIGSYSVNWHTELVSLKPIKTKMALAATSDGI